MKILKYLVAVVAAAMAGYLTTAHVLAPVAGTESHQADLSTPISAPNPGLSIATLSCKGASPGILAMVGHLTEGHSAAELRAATGYGVAPAISGGDPSLVVIFRRTGGGFPSLNVLRSQRSLRSVAFMLAQSTDPTLVSCNRLLSDSPGARSFLQRAQRALEEAHLVGPKRMSNVATSFLIGEDPTNHSHVLVTIVVPHRSANPPQTQTTYVVEMDRSTGTVLALGKGAWYATGQQEMDSEGGDSGSNSQGSDEHDSSDSE